MIEFSNGTVAPPLYSLAVDLGDLRDYTSIVIMERPLWIGDEESGWREATEFYFGDDNTWIAPNELPDARSAVNLAYWNMTYGRPAYPAFRVRHIERLPLGSGYPHAVATVAVYMNRLKEYCPLLLVDHTGVGRPVIQSFRSVGLNPLGIHLHAGAGSRYVGSEHRYNVSVRELVAAAQVFLENSRLQIAAELEYADVLKKELLAFRRKINPQNAHESFSAWREKDHDDLVFALAMCCWYHMRTVEPHEGEFEEDWRSRKWDPYYVPPQPEASEYEMKRSDRMTLQWLLGGR